MTPAVTIDDSPDFSPHSNRAQNGSTSHRTLLLSPPSLSSHPEVLNKLFDSYDRSQTDVQMLDRLALGLVSLPASTYDVILLLTDADGTRTEGQKLMDRNIMAQIVAAMKTGGRLRSQDGTFGRAKGLEKTEAILAGLIIDDSGEGGMTKPDDSGMVQTVPLKRTKRAANANGPLAQNGQAADQNGHTATSAPPHGVGFVDFSDDFEEPTGDDCDLVDEDDLVTEEDLKGIVQRKTLAE